MDIAPILTLISALTSSGPVRSSTLPPSTHGTSRSRSRIASQVSSIGLPVVKEWSSSTMSALLVLGCDPCASVRARERHSDGPDEAHGRGLEGRTRPAHRGDLVVGDARPGRGPGAHARRPTPARCACSRGPAASRRSTTTTRPASRRRSTTRSSTGRRSSSGRPPSSGREGRGGARAGGRTPSDQLRARRRRGRPAHGQRDRQAERLGYEAVLGAVRDAQGRGRGRDRVRRTR